MCATRSNRSAYKVVTYRAGGWMNATWHATCATRPGEETKQRVLEIERAGYKTRTFNLNEMTTIGLPVGFCVHADPLTGRMDEKTCDCV